MSDTKRRPPRAALPILIAALTLHCTTLPPVRDPGPPRAEGDPCVAMAGDVIPGDDPIVIAVRGTVRAERAPVPSGDAEVILFAMLYEPLVRIDCGGTVRPAGALDWAATGDSTVWVFTIAGGVSGGRPVSAADWIESWGRSARIAGAPPLLRRVHTAARAKGQRTIHIDWRGRPRDLVSTLAHPAASLAIHDKKHRGATPFPGGTGLWSIDRSVPTLPGQYLLRAGSFGARTRPRHAREIEPAARPILLKTEQDEPEIDLLRDDHDLVFLRSAIAWEAAGGREANDTLEADGERNAHGTATNDDGSAGSWSLLETRGDEYLVVACRDPELLARGVRDAETGAALAAIVPARTADIAPRGSRGTTTGTRGAPKRIDERVVYPAWRDDARALAERFVAHAREDERYREARAAGLPAPNDWHGSLEAGEASAYVFPVRLEDGEDLAAAVARRVPWTAHWSARARVLSGLAVRADIRNITHDADGFPRLDRVGRAGQAP